MIQRTTVWALSNRGLVIAAALLLLAVGAYIAPTMPVDVFPDLTAPTVTVITEAHGMTPTEVETQVTFPIETALNGGPSVRRVRSSTAAGISVAWVEFDWGADIYKARQVVSERVGLVVENLPPEAGRPTLSPISSIMGEILFLSLTSDRHSGIELRTLADTQIRRRLLAVAGVSQVTPIGGGEKQYQVVLDPMKLNAYQVSVADVAKALEETNQNASAGFMVEGAQEYVVQGVGRVRSTADIAETVVVRRKGLPVKVAQLGHVRIGEAVKRGEGSSMGKPAVILGIQKQPDANTLRLTRALDDVLDEIEEALPEGIKINRHVFRQSDFIEVAVRNVVQAVRDGGIFVIAIVVLFLLNLRAAFISLLAIPLSLIAAVIAFKAFGATINTMTLGGLAIAIGVLSDNAVVVVENIFRRLRENAARSEGERRPVGQVVLAASLEIQRPIVYATLIVILVVTPVFFLSGVEGRLLAPLGVAYAVSVLASLVVALTVTPVLSHLLLPATATAHAEKESVVIRMCKGLYRPVIRTVLGRSWSTVAMPALALLGLALCAVPRLGRAFLPEFNEGTLTISAVTLPGTSLAESNEMGRLAEEIMLSHGEVVATARRTGRAELDEHAMGVESAEIDVSLNWGRRSKEEFLGELRRALSVLPGMNFIIGQPISHRIDHMLSGTRASIAVKIFGEDLYTLRALAEKARSLMAEVPGVVDLSVEQQMDIPVLKVEFDRQSLARYGLRITDLSATLETAFMGRAVSRVLEGRNAFDLVVRIGPGDKPDMNWIENLPVDAADGCKVPLKALARIRKDMGPNAISRENVQRKIVVMCNVADRDVTSVVEDIRARVDAGDTIPKGYYVQYSGQFESAQETGRVLSVLGVLVITAIAFLLYMAFGSYRDALLVLSNLPLALIGGVAGVFLSGGTLSVASMIGFITLLGIATPNGIVLVSHIRHLLKSGEETEIRVAVERGALERLAP
ncbi:MAG: efflux RND transporter permease subunit, partial [Planctomycetes bacterium]|nr:efflux RND transporter permease subunit [Planctomycetota bacterium]